MLARIVLAFVDAEDDGDIFFLRRSGDDDLLGSALEVGCRLGAVGEKAGGFHNDLGSIFGPVYLGRVFLGDYFNHLAVNDDGVFLGFHDAFVDSVAGVVFKKMGVGFGVG